MHVRELISQAGSVIKIARFHSMRFNGCILHRLTECLHM